MKLATPTKVRNGVYRTRLRLGGKSMYVYGSTEAECRRNATAVKAEHLTGKVVQTKCTLTTAEAIEKYIANRPKLSPSTVRGYTSIKNNVFRDAKDEFVADVDWQAVIDQDPHSPKTVRNAWGLIASVLTDNRVPVPKVRLPQPNAKERPFLQPEQIPIFIAAIRDNPCEVAALLALHSLRRSELLDVTLADIDLKRNIIHVRGSAVMDKNNSVIHKATNKNASSKRDVPIMIPRLAELCRAQKGGKSDYIVTCHPNTIWREVNSVCRRAGLPEVGCHGLRHSFVSLAYHLGWSELATMSVAGYADYNTMRKIYTHLADADKEKAVKSMEKFFNAPKTSSTSKNRRTKRGQSVGKTKP